MYTKHLLTTLSIITVLFEDTINLKQSPSDIVSAELPNLATKNIVSSVSL